MNPFSIDQFNFTKYSSLVDFLNDIIGNYMVGIIGIIAIVFLIKAGFEYITSGGDEKKTENAKNSIIYIVVGLIICFVSPLVIRFLLQRILGAE